MGCLNDLEVDQDLAFERKSWAAQRIGWGVMTLAIVAALAGLLGSGPASRTRAETPDGAIAVEYDRFVRANAPTDLDVSVGRGAIRDGVVRLGSTGGTSPRSSGSSTRSAARAQERPWTPS